jgi:D-glycero-D-manno-heptose 1,7-bisphosphate phosphatase
MFDENDVAHVHDRLSSLLAEQDVWIDAYYFCPHHVDGRVRSLATLCDCRKPAPGMLLRAAYDWHVELGRSWMIGDLPTDVEAGRAAGCRTIRVGELANAERRGTVPGLLEAAEAIVGPAGVSSSAASAARRAAPRW